MFVVMNRLETDAPEVFERGFGRSMRSTLEGVPGLVRASLLRPTTDGRLYASVMEFVDEAAFKDWMASESFGRAHAGVRDQAPTVSTVETYVAVVELAS